MADTASLVIQGDTLSLVGVLDHDSVLVLNTQGQAWLCGVAPTVCYIELSQVTYSSSAGIALLLSWLRQARQQHKNLQVRPLPPKLAALVRMSGLAEVFTGSPMH